MRKGACCRRISVRQAVRPAPLRPRLLKDLVHRALDAAAVKEADLRIRVVGEAEMARWNRTCFGRSGATNVIAFPEDNPAERLGRRAAGDILVCLPVCLSQTSGWREPPEARLLFFVVHGLLHILGYDHLEGGAAARAMGRAQTRLFRAAAAAARARPRR